MIVLSKQKQDCSNFTQLFIQQGLISQNQHYQSFLFPGGKTQTSPEFPSSQLPHFQLNIITHMSTKSTGDLDPPKSTYIKRDSVSSNLSVQSEKFVKHNLHNFEKDYEVVSKLGEGSFGAIFKVKHKQLQITRALKIIYKKNKDNEIIPKQEIDALIKLDHPNIIKIYEYYQTKDKFYIIMELFDGKELFDELVIEDYFTEGKAARVSLDILKAIHYMHQQKIIHRDMKAENIMIKTEGDKSWIKLIDFGLGIANTDKIQRDKIGTPEYIAPEVIMGKYDEKCDMWGFGVILYTMLGGTMPFLGDTQEEVLAAVKSKKIVFQSKEWDSVSSEGKELTSKLLERNPKKRLSADQALSHPWFKKFLSKNAKPVELKDTLTRLKEFQLQNHLHTAAYAYINNHMSSVEQKRKLDQIFSFLDTNHNGVLEFTELHKGYQILYGNSVGLAIAQEVFNKLDVNRSGTIQYNQFITYAMLKHKQIPQIHLQQTFKLFDTNKDGMISTEQLKRILSNGIEDVAQQEWDNIIKSVDKNDDGEISKDEFFSCMTKVSEICTTVLSNIRTSVEVESTKVKKTLSSSTIETRRSLRLKKDDKELSKSAQLQDIPEVIEFQASQELQRFI